MNFVRTMFLWKDNMYVERFDNVIIWYVQQMKKNYILKGEVWLLSPPPP